MKPNEKGREDKGNERDSSPIPNANPEGSDENLEDKESEVKENPEPGVEGDEGSGGSYGRPREEENEDEGKHV